MAQAITSYMGYIKKVLPLILFVSSLSYGNNPEDELHDFGELFAGSAHLSKAMRMIGFKGVSLDREYDVAHDILTPAGFLVCLWLAMRIRRGGVFWFASPCSSWIWLARASTGRRADNVLGSSNDYIEGQNALVSRLCYIWAVLIKRGVYFIIEQPDSSLLFDHPKFKMFKERFMKKGAQFYRSTVDLGLYNMVCQKKIILDGTAPYIPELGASMSHGTKKEMWECEFYRKTASVEVVEGQEKITGSPTLWESQIYPFGFCARHALCYSSFRNNTDLPTECPNTLVDSDSDSFDDDSLDDLKGKRVWVGDPPKKLKKRKQ